MLVFDGDYPMAYSGTDANRDLTRSLAEVRATPFGPRDIEDHTGVLATLPEMRRGRVAAALVKIAARHENPGTILWSYRASAAARGIAAGHLAYYRALEAEGEARILTTGPAVAAHLAEWQAAPDPVTLPVGMVVGMEGADPILEPDDAHRWWADGVRVVSLAHYGPSRYADGTGTGVDGRLKPQGRELLAIMDRIGLLLDVSHVSDRANRESLEIYGGPVLASHSNTRAVVPGERQMPDDLIRAVAARGGVIGVTFDAWMLNHRREYDWSLQRPITNERGTDDGPITLEDVVNHILHICDLTGSTRHVGIGGDTDGQGGRLSAPAEIESVADFARVGDHMARRGFDADAIAAVLYRNWGDFYARNLPL